MNKESLPISPDAFALNKESVPEDEPKTSVVVSMFNARPETIEVVEKLFLPSVLRNASSDIQLVIVDDGSPLYKETKRAVEAFQRDLTTRMGDVVYFRNEENLGFAGSYNKGIERAEGEVVVITNDDIYFPEGSVMAMTNILRLADKAGALGPLINSAWSFQNITLFERIKNYSPEELQRIEAFAAWLRQVMVGKTYEMKGKNRNLLASCLALKREALEAVGYFDERYQYGMFEDIDLCRRLRNAGYHLVLDEATFVEHGGPKGASMSLKQDRTRHIRAMIANAIKYADKWNAHLTLPLYLAKAILQGSGLMTVTGEIIREAKEKGLWEDYLELPSSTLEVGYSRHLR